MPDTEISDFGKLCHETAIVDEDMDGGGVLICALPVDHGGLHYDSADNITWKFGEPDA